ncbi:MAG: HNH endonuclease [Deltaproteobacteria bacterium]|nr:HNH endonuclease [Deltaproteobacteria bacterium]
MVNDQRYHPEWETVSRYVRELFDFFCAKCGKNCRNSKKSDSVLQVHHIDANPGNNDLENLIPLCATCHLKIEKEARLHAPYDVIQLELFENQSYIKQMKIMRQNAFDKYVLGRKKEKTPIDKETFENEELEWEINESS